jgi:NAD(P)-dependent dehydrogenase (short-subunit alcohol dehydrogenase family)
MNYFKDLKSQTILVTGASRGIGRTIAEHLHGHGCTVLLHYNNSKQEVQNLQNKLGSRAHIFTAELGDMHAVHKLYEEVTKQFTVDTVVHNAGIFLNSPVDGNPANWQADTDRTLDINLKAPALLSRFFLDHFKSNGGGRFIFIGSRAAFKGETEDHLMYAASKGGLTSLSRSIARSQGKNNIKSFVVAPGFTRTEMAEEFIKKHGEKAVTHDLSLNKLTTPADIAPLVCLIASGHMDHTTGTCVDVNGGSYIH